MNLQKESRREERIKYLIVFATLMCIETVIAIYVHDAFIRPYVEDNTLLRILIGSTFDLKDIVCYGIGCILLGIYEWYGKRNSTKDSY